MEKIEIRRSRKKIWIWMLSIGSILVACMIILEFIFHRNRFSWSTILVALCYFLFFVILPIFHKRDLLLYTLDDEGILHHQGNWKKIPWQEIKRAKRLGKNEGVFLELKNPKEFIPKKFSQRLKYQTISSKGITIWVKFTEMSGKEILALIDDHLAKVATGSELPGVPEA